MTDMYYKLNDFIDIKEFQDIYNNFNKIAGINIGMIDDSNNNALIERKLCSICKDFHCKTPEAIDECLNNHLECSRSAKNMDAVFIKKCKSDLITGSSKVMLNGNSIATLIFGQVLFKEPDYEIFRMKAEQNKYNVEKYLEALKEVPILDRKAFEDYIKHVSEISSEMASLNYRRNVLKEDKEKMRKVEVSIKGKITSLKENMPIIKNKVNDEDVKCCYSCNLLLEGIAFFDIVYNKKNIAVNYKITDVNPAFESIFNLKKEDVIDQYVTDALRHTSIPYIELFSNVLNNHTKTIINTTIPQNGKFLEVTAVQSHSNVILLKVIDVTDSKLLISENKDITKKSIKELEIATSMLDKVLDITFDSIVIFDNAGIIKYWNKASEELFGFSENEVIGKNLSNFIIAEERTEVFSKALETKFTTYLDKSNEELFIKKDNSKIIVEFSISKFNYNETSLNIAISRDITNRKSLELQVQEKEEALVAQNEELRAQEEELTAQNEELKVQEEELVSQNEELNLTLDSLKKTQTFVDNSSVASYIVNEEATIIYANKEGIKLLNGDKEEEVLNYKIYDFNKEFNKEVWKDHYKKLVKNKQLNFETTLQTKDNLDKPVKISSNHFKIEDKEYIFTYIIDISENKKLQNDLENERNSLKIKVEEQTKVLKDYVKQLEEADKHKNMFLSNLSHELRTPLNSILGFSDMLLNGSFGILNEKQLYYTKIISNNGLYLLDIISDLLDIAKIDSGKMALNAEPCTPYKLINDVLESLETDIVNKKLRVNTCYDRSIKDILLDKKRFKQIIFNIISNAIKYTNESGLISIRQKQEENKFVISIQDNGIGIPANRLEHIFGEFYQINNSESKNIDGLGIGLPLVKRLVKLHNGDIRVESQLDKGSTFYVTLPLLKAEKAQLLEKSKSTDHMHSMPKNKKILVVEDNESNLSLILEALSCYDHQINIARNGQEAIDMTESCNPDLILMDVRMPVMDGMEAASHIKANPKFKDTPIISLSASVDVDSIKKQREAGFDFHISKPIRLNKLLQVLNIYLK